MYIAKTRHRTKTRNKRKLINDLEARYVRVVGKKSHQSLDVQLYQMPYFKSLRWIQKSQILTSLIGLILLEIKKISFKVFTGNSNYLVVLVLNLMALLTRTSLKYLI